MDVSVIIPCRNEEKYVKRCLTSLINQNFDGKYEILILDGMSTDETRKIIKKIQKKNNNIKLIDNPQIDSASARNIGIKISKGDIIIRCDAHSEYPRNYISELVRYHKKGIGSNIGGGIDTYPENNTNKAKAIADVMSSKFGVGSSFRTIKGDKPIEVNTVPFGSWKKEIFKEVGLFDNSFIRAHDLEHNIRIKKKNKKIILLPWLRVKYYTKGTYTEIAKKLYNMGFWKNKVNIKHNILTSKRQLFPAGLVSFILLSILLLFINFNLFFQFIVFIYSIYFLIIFYGTYLICKKNRFNIFFYTIGAFFIIHLSYGIGYICGFIYFFSKNFLAKILFKIYIIFNHRIQFHLEKLEDDKIWKKIKKLVLDGISAQFFIGFPYCVEQDNRKWIERIRWLQNNNQELGLHIHLYKIKKESDFNSQLRKFKKAIDFCKKHNINYNNQFAPGWWNYNLDTIKIAQKFRIKKFYYKERNLISLFVKKWKYKDVNMIPILKIWHDKDLR